MNTLLVTVDALRTDHVGYHGYERPTTPNLDSFAAENAHFSNAFSNGTFTSAALPALLTGSLRKDSSEPTATGRNLEVCTPNLASVLQQNGIHTVGINTNLLFYLWYEKIDGFSEFEHHVPDIQTDENQSSNSGFKEFLKQIGKSFTEKFKMKRQLRRWYNQFKNTHELQSSAYYDATEVTEKVINWLNNWGGGDFFIWVHYMDPHEPYGYFDSMNSEPFNDNSIIDDINQWRAEEIAKRARQAPETVSKQERKILLTIYDSYIRFFDDELGRLFDSLRQRNLYHETQIVVTADHGEEFGEHGMYYHQNKPYEELIHVPLAVKSSIVEDGIYDEQVRHIDIAPTVVVGHDIKPEVFNGDSLGETHSDRPTISLGSDRPYLNTASRPFGAIRTPNLKLIYHHEENNELYDLVSDPDENNDIAEKKSDTAKRLQERFLTHVRISGGDHEISEEESLDVVSDNVKQQMEDLGYL